MATNGTTPAFVISAGQSDPNGLSPKAPGAKLDAGKSPVVQGVFQYFPRALNLVSFVSLIGANKYAWKGWESVSDGVNRYSNAMGRHILAEETEGPIDSETKQLHAAQVAWNALARLELIVRELEKDPTLAQELAAAAHIKR